MFQSIEYIKDLGRNATTKFHEYEYKLVDSDFSCNAVGIAQASAVIREYSKRKLNVAANLVKYFKYYEKRYDWSIASQIAWAEKQPLLFTPEIKADLQKYLPLL